MNYTEKDLQLVGQTVLKDLAQRGTNILALHGDLGAGKTTLVSSIAKELGVVENIISPTFIVYRVYDIAVVDSSWQKLVHIDAYRLEGEVDAKKIRLDELFADATNLVCIEWPEHVGELLPKNALHATIAYTGEHERSIEIG